MFKDVRSVDLGYGKDECDYATAGGSLHGPTLSLEISTDVHSNGADAAGQVATDRTMYDGYPTTDVPSLSPGAWYYHECLPSAQCSLNLYWSDAKNSLYHLSADYNTHTPDPLQGFLTAAHLIATHS